MTDLEFDIIDEMYFVIHYNDLKNYIKVSEKELGEVLLNMLEKGWIKCFESPDNEVYNASEGFYNNYKQYYYLATKEALKLHNGL